MIREAIQRVVNQKDLNAAEAREVMTEIMEGRCTDAQIACLLTALRLKTESVEEIVAFAQVMREKATRIEAPSGAIDLVGTGGDEQHTFNISTAAAIVAAGGGAVVAKHGNRSVSSTSGSADVLRALGVNIDAEPAAVERSVREAGIGFLFAPKLHGAMKFAIGPRKEIGIRTVFNILGPLTNPAGAPRMVLGVYAPYLVSTLAMVLRGLGLTHALVVHGKEGLDEISTAGESLIAELKDGVILETSIAPEDFGLTRSPLTSLVVKSAEESAALIREVLAGKSGPARDIVLLNAGAALTVAGRASDLATGVLLAAAAIDEGRAQTALERMIAIVRA